jgi:transcriptional regulator
LYVPPSFSVADRDWALELIARYPFGLLVSGGAEYAQMSHLPMLARERDGAIYLLGHVARANPHAEAILAGSAATAIFSGPHAFVSASWYEEPYRTVPTWNYTAVHAEGRLVEGDKRSVVEALSSRFEGERHSAWQMARLTQDYVDKQFRGIVAFEMRVERLIPVAKLSQNRTAADRERVIDALLHSDDPVDRDCAKAMQGFSTPALNGDGPR